MTGFNPTFWGPYFWKTIHLAILGLPGKLTTEHKHALVQFFNSLIYLLPCQACQAHYTSYLEEYPLDVSSKEKICNGSGRLHNSVNKRLDKKEYTTSEAIALTLTTEKAQAQVEKPKYNFTRMFVTIIIVVIVFAIGIRMMKKT
jgi:hypothetical protein